MNAELNAMIEQLESVQAQIKAARDAERQKAQESRAARRQAIVQARKIMREFKITAQELAV